MALDHANRPIAVSVEETWRGRCQALEVPGTAIRELVHMGLVVRYSRMPFLFEKPSDIKSSGHEQVPHPRSPFTNYHSANPRLFPRVRAIAHNRALLGFHRTQRPAWLIDPRQTPNATMDRPV